MEILLASSFTRTVPVTIPSGDTVKKLNIEVEYQLDEAVIASNASDRHVFDSHVLGIIDVKDEAGKSILKFETAQTPVQIRDALVKSKFGKYVVSCLAGKYAEIIQGEILGNLKALRGLS